MTMVPVQPFNRQTIPPRALHTHAVQFQGTPGGSENLESHLFYPPKPNRSLIKAAQSITHWAFSKPMGFRIDVSKADIAKLQALLKTGESTILAINHPTLLDPITSLELARKANFQFMVMSAVELFEKVPPFSGCLLPRLGSFSVNRGGKDKHETIQTALEVVKNAKFPLLIAPEGHITYANRTVGKLKEGAARIAIEAAKTGKEVRIIPISIYYQRNYDLQPQLLELVRKLEDHLKIPDNRNISLLERTRALFEAMVAERGRRYNIPAPSGNAADHLEAIKQTLFKRLETTYSNPDPDATATYEMRFRRLATHIAEELRETTDKTRRLQMRKDLAMANDGLELSLNPCNYLTDDEPNRLLETLTRLHYNITGKRLTFLETCRNITARIKVGDPISVRELLQNHATRRSNIPAATEISHLIQHALQTGIDKLAAEKP